jgi:hypothetical protein
MTCPTCIKYLGMTREHDVCPVRASLFCSQCGCYGHVPVECDSVTHVERPRTLEEMIPAEVRARWGITTSTYNPCVAPKPSLEDMEREIAENNTIVIRYRDGKLDARIREFMKARRIVTVHKMDGNLQKLRTWAVQQGKKVRLVQEK